MAVVRIAKLRLGRHLAQAYLHAVCAARRERAACGRIQQVDRLTLDRHKALYLLSAELGNRIDESFGVFMLGLIEYLIRRAVLNDVTGIHDGDSFAHAGDDAEVMGYHYDAHAELLSEFLHKLEYLSLNGNVESRCGLVGYEQFGLAREGYCYHDSLTHTAGELMGILLEALCGLVDADKLEQLLRAVICLFFALARMQADNLGYLIADSIDRLRLVMGSWKIIETSLPLILRISFSLIFSI